MPGGRVISKVINMPGFEGRFLRARTLEGSADGALPGGFGKVIASQRELRKRKSQSNKKKGTTLRTCIKPPRRHKDGAVTRGNAAVPSSACELWHRA